MKKFFAPRRGLLALALAALLLLSALPALAEAPKTLQPGKLVVGMELAYPPFETSDEQGVPQGISPDFARDLAESLNLELVIENLPWDGLIPALLTGKVDMVVSSMTITEPRREQVDFSIPYANAYLALLTNKEAGITSVEDLNQPGRKVAVKIGSTGYYYAQKNLSQAEILAFPDESACVTEVVQGKADAFIYDQLTIYRNWQRHEESTKPVFIPFQDVESWGAAFNKGNEGLVSAVNTFIVQYTQEGGFDRLTEKHLGEEKKVFDELGFKWFFDLDAAQQAP